MPALLLLRFRPRGFEPSAAVDDPPLRAITRSPARPTSRLAWLLTGAVVVALSTGDFVPASGNQQTLWAASLGASGAQSPSAPTLQPPPVSHGRLDPLHPDGSNPDVNSQLSKKQQQDLLKSNFERMKHDADELTTLAKSLQTDLDKSNENVLSLKILDRAERIEKLARKIKSEAKGD